MSLPAFALVFRRLGTLAFLMGMLSIKADASPGSEALSVRSEVAPGPCFVGQGFELGFGVIAGGQRPNIDPPRIAGARTWAIGTDVRPITTTSIGSVVTHENLFLMRFRVVPQRPGTLEIPAVKVQIKGRSGRSQPKSVSIQPVPLVGRPAEFLGGVGPFELGAEVSPKVIRVGQVMEFRIKVTGPAAWGMTDRPDLARFSRLGIGLRIEPQPDETVNEPPARSFVYRLRPTHAGEAALPPVAIAAFDPSLARYLTHVTAGVPIRVVAVAPFDPTTVHYDPPSTTMSRPAIISVIVVALAMLSCTVYLILSLVRRRLVRPHAFGPELARRFAKQTARSLRSLSAVEISMAPRADRMSTGHPLFRFRHPNSRFQVANSPNVSSEMLGDATQRLVHDLSVYVSLGTGQSLGVMTPDEAREGVARLTGSDKLVAHAGELAARCDSILYGPRVANAATELPELLDDARRLFEALGQVKGSRERGR